VERVDTDNNSQQRNGNFRTCSEFEVFVFVRRDAAVLLSYWCPKRLRDSIPGPSSP